MDTMTIRSNYILGLGFARDEDLETMQKTAQEFDEWLSSYETELRSKIAAEIRNHQVPVQGLINPRMGGKQVFLELEVAARIVEGKQ